MVNKERIYSWIESHKWWIGALVSLGALMSFAETVLKIIFWGAGKMTPDILDISIVVILFSCLILFSFMAYRDRWVKRLRIKEEVNTKLEEKIKQYDGLVKKQESQLEEKIQFTDCEITSDGDIDNPITTITQTFVNMSELPLKISKVDIQMKAGAIELDSFFYNPPDQTTQFGDKITASENGAFSPLRLDCWIKCKTGNIQIVPKFQGKMIEIVVKGVVEFAVGTKRIVKSIERRRQVAFKRRPAQIVS